MELNEEEAKTYTEAISKNTDISSSHQAARSTSDVLIYPTRKNPCMRSSSSSVAP